MALGQALLTKPPRVHQQQNQTREEVQAKASAAALDQQLKFEQSLEIVQTLLAASISCLSFLRGLLPEECFVEKRYGGRSSTAVSYRSFTSDYDDEAFYKKGSNGTRIKRLRRGHSREADQLLDWLETGIFDALSRGYLKAVQLGIYVDDKNPDIVVESYTFSFAYREKDGGPSVSLRVTDMHGHGVTANDANKNLQLVLRRLVLITQRLPPLPDKRWLTIRLHYLDGTPKDYDPPNFSRLPSSAFALRIREDESREVGKHDCGELNAGYHAVNLKVSTLSEVDPEERPRRRRVSRFVNLDPDLGRPQLKAGSIQSPHGRMMHGLCEEGEIIDAPPNRIRSLGEHRGGSRDVDDYPQPSPPPNRKSQLPGRETQERLALRSMLVPSERGSEIPETQSCNFDLEQSQNPLSGRPSWAPSNSYMRRRSENLASRLQVLPRSDGDGEQASAVNIPSSSGQRIPPRAMTARKPYQPQGTLMVAPVSDTGRISQATGRVVSKIKILETRKAELAKTKIIAETKGKSIKKPIDANDHIIACECGSKETSEDMICCDICESWQHTECYGFTSTKDPRIPDYHVCYSCLLSKFEESLLEELRGLALFRRAVKLVWDGNSFPATNRAFANKLGCDLPTASQITRRLLEEGFITPISTTRTARQRKTVNRGPVKYRVVKTDDMASIMELQYFDPLAKVCHHYENPALPRNPPAPSPKGSPPTATTKLPDNIPPGYDDSIAQDSQTFENHFEEAIVLSESSHKEFERPTDVESTADEEEFPGPSVLPNTTHIEPNSIMSAHDIIRANSRVTSSFPQHNPLGGSVIPGEAVGSAEVPRQLMVNVSTASFDVYFGYDSEG